MKSNSPQGITSDEAERRGAVYNLINLSFLFNTNKYGVLDATRLGNKTRFLNHASTPKEGLNCEVKVLLVNGEHRIKFVALRDIQKGDELLFDYGEKFIKNAKLNLAKAKNKGLVVVEEVHGDLNRLKISTRGTARRGGRGGRGGAGNFHLFAYKRS
jgi:SET domain-containing protein